MIQEEIKRELEKDFALDLAKNIDTIQTILEKSVDFVKRDIIFHNQKHVKAVCFYTDGLVNTTGVETIIQALLYKAKKIHPQLTEMREHELFAEEMKETVLINHSAKTITKIEDGVDGILSGDTLVIIDQSTQALLVSTKGWDTRSVEEPQTEQVVRGPRDGFTESIRTNTSLVRRRIRDPLLRIEGMKIGLRSKTDVNIAYIKGIVKEGLVDEVKSRLNGIKMDAIIDSGYIEELIEDAPFSPFTTVQSTERPDKVASAILEGRVAVFVDNSPFVLIVPTYFWQLLQASDDYYSRYMSGSFFRIIRYIALIISLTLPSIYVLLVSFHQEMIPTPLALTIASGREVIPFPVLLEAVMMEIAFELMREAGLRMPKPVGQAVSIVGSLVVGQAAVQAGIISPFMVIIIALTGIASFAIPNYAAAFSIRLIRFPLLVASGTFGLLGFAAVISLLAIHAMALRSYGESYLAPATPFKPTDQKDVLIRMPWWKMQQKPELAKGSDPRQGKHQLPKPSNNGAPDKQQGNDEQGQGQSQAQDQSQAKQPEKTLAFKKIPKKWKSKNRGNHDES